MKKASASDALAAVLAGLVLCWLTLGALAQPCASQAAPVQLQVMVVDGDKEVRGSGCGAMSGVPVLVTEEAGGRQWSATSGKGGLLTVPDAEAGTRLVIAATAPRRYVTFPVRATARQDAVVNVPLYHSGQQWLRWGRTPDHRRVGPATGKPAKLLWRVKPGNNMEFPPTLAYGVVVYGSYHGFLAANDQRTGRLLWRYYPGTNKRPSKFASQVTVSTWVQDGVRVARVYWTDLSGWVGCNDLFTGQLIWRANAGRAPGTGGKRIAFRSLESSPLVVGETVYTCTRYDRRKNSRAGLWALNRRSGRVRWFMRMAGSAQTKIAASPAYRDGRIYVATYDGRVYAVRATDNASRRKRYWWRRITGELYSTPTVTASRIYVGSKSDGRVYCLRRSNGRILWRSTRLAASVHGSPAVYGGRVFIGAGRRFFALRAGNGSIAWQQATSRRVWGSASVLNGVVYYSCYGHTWARRASSGRLVWSKAVGRYSPVTATRHLIVITGRQTIYGFRPAG